MRAARASPAAPARRRLRRTWRRAHGLLAAALLAGCAAPAPRPNVLLVLADTLRADKLGAYGGPRDLTPVLDELAAGGALFEHALAHSPWTLPSAASLLSSLHPQQHGAGGRVPDFRALLPEVETLPARFRRAGYDTAAIVNVSFLAQEFGLTRGFEHVDADFGSDNRGTRRAEATTRAALEWLSRPRERPFLLLVHYFDPHTEYDPPQPYRRQHAAPPDREGGFAFGSGSEVIAIRTGKQPLDRDALRRAERLYDGEIAYMDRWIGELLAGLARLGVADSTLVTFTADHGEEFLDHGGFEHGHTLYRELLHVPLILRGPGVGPPRRVAPAVRHLDVAPTLCELAGVEPAAAFAGRSLVPLLRGEALPPAPALAYGNFWGPPLASLQAGGYKLILPARGSGGRPQLYRPADDPAEARDRAAAEPEVVARLRRQASALEHRLGRRRSGARVELPSAVRDQLEALGYAE